MMKEICKLMFIIVFSLLAFSCSEEGINENTSGESSGKEQEIVLSMNVPMIKEPNSQLRSIGTAQENAIQTIDLLAFRKDNTGSYFDYHTVGKITDNTQSASTQTSRVIVRLKDNEQDVVIITNAGTVINEMVKSQNWEDTPKDVFLAKLEYALSGTNTKWNTVSATNYTALPMWGETSAKITQNTTQLSVTLLRMLAKIDVQLDQTAGTKLTSKFKLKSVRLYNTQTKGRIIPNSSVVQKTANNISVTAPSLPETPKKQLGPLVYNDFTSPGATDVAIRGAIYTFESEAPVDDNPLEATCLVVGGIYDKDTKETFYRVDFLEDDGVTYKDILRNYKYLINITDVMDRGHEDPEEAFESKAENMQTEVEMWTGNDLAVSFNGQYFLYVNKNKFDFSREACTTAQNNNILIVNTNYKTSKKQGWTINNITDEDGKSPVTWLTVTAPNGTKNTGAYSESLKDDSLILTFTQNTTGRPRYANIIFAAGRLRYTVQIVQDIREGVSITFYSGQGRISGNELVPDGQVIDTLIFEYSNIKPQDALPFTITWTPKSSDVRVYETRRYALPINGVSRFLDFNTNPSKIRVIDSHTGIYVYHIGLDYKHTTDDQLRMYYAQSAMGFYVSNGVEEIERVCVIVCYPPK